MSEFEDLTIDVAWGHITGRWYGNRNVRPILALHGWQDNLGTWNRLIPILPQHIGILCIDFPGHGRSTKFPVGIAYHAIDYLGIIARIVKEYKWEKVSLMGHSMGAILCFIFTAIYPHMVELLIQIDSVKPLYIPIDMQIENIKLTVEKSLIAGECMETFSLKEPPSYTYHELEDILHFGSGQSVAKEHCKHILSRNIAKSRKYPDKYFFSRDSLIKYAVNMPTDNGLALEMAKRIKNTAYMLIRTDTQNFIQPIDDEVANVLKANNKHFEYHTVHNSTHHLHLNKAEEVAAFIKPFIIKYHSLTTIRGEESDDAKPAESKSKL